MKKEKNNSIAKRLVVICSLCLALIVALGAFSFAWIQNYGDVGKATITTGKMLYKITMYRVNGDKTESKVLFDTGDLTNPGTDALASEGTETITKDIGNSEFPVGKDEQVFFVVEKYDDSIDFDVSIAFDNDGLASQQAYENVGQIKYWLYDDSEKLLGYKKTVDDKTVVDADAYIAAEKGKIDETKVNPSLSTIWTTLQEVNLSGTDKIGAAVRFKLDSNATFDQYFEDEKIPFRIKFCIAQKDKLPEESDKVQTHYVNEPLELYDVMQKYGFNDEIVIDGSIDYSDYGDLVFTRPCKLTLIRANLTIKGNLSFSYMYDGAFTIDTVSDGHIFVGKNSSGAAGNFRIDLPNGKIEIKGANNDATGKADIYVEGMLSANASKDEGEGIFLQGTRICDNTASDDLEPLFLNGVAKISISNRTRVGKISALSKADSNGVACTKLIIENSGYIEKIDLSKMVDDGTYITSPVIDIDNRGTIGNVNRAEGVLPNTDDGDVIILPTWAKKFDEKDSSSNKDNTRIKANEGSSKILAITSDRDYSVSPETVNQLKFFFSLGDRGDNIAGYPDDIEYNHRKVFVEAIDGDKTKIIIHYETPTAIVKKENTSLEGLTTLKSYVDFYSTHDAYGIEGEGIIAPAAQLKEVKIICYGNKALTAPPLKQNSTTEYETGTNYDYNFIKTMTALESLDLSDAVSQDKKVPDNAFKGMASLTNIQMSESDNTWGKYIFTGTGVDEITFPQALTKLDNARSGNRIKDNVVLDGIRYVYTSITIVDGIYSNGNNCLQYYFTPDDFTYSAYQKINNDSKWHSRIFINNGVVKYGEYFLRNLNTSTTPPTCEFVTFTGGFTLELGVDGKYHEVRESWVREEKFDFNKILVGDITYNIVSFDPYAFFDKLYSDEFLEIELKENVEKIGKYAFARSYNDDTGNGLSTVRILGNPSIEGHSFEYNNSLIEVNAPELTSLKGGYNFYGNASLKTVYMPKLSIVESTADIGECPNIDTVEIGVIERTDANKEFYTSTDTNSFAKFYIHTEGAKDAGVYKAALAADYRYIFVKKSYSKLYRATATYTGVTDISGYNSVGNENDIKDLIVADVDGKDLVSGKQHAYYYVLDYTDRNNVSANLVACLLPSINNPNNDYITMASFNHNGEDYVVDYIGSAAYHFTHIIARNITISDKVTEIGNYAFDSSKGLYKKYCGTLDLNNVVKTGTNAFYYMDMARIIGYKLEEVGKDSLSNNSNLRIANLPNLSRSNNTKIFVGAKELRVIYVGYSDFIDYDEVESLRKNYIRFINFTNGSMAMDSINVNVVVNSTEATLAQASQNAFITSSGFDEILISDYYNLNFDLSGMSISIELPGYVYYNKENKNDNLSLIAVSPDLAEFGDFKNNVDGSEDYITPGYLYKYLYKEADAENSPVYRYTAVEPHENSFSSLTVTSLGTYAYGAVSINDVSTFKVADTINKLHDGALSGSAYTGGSDTLVTLLGVTNLDLANVTEVGSQACKGAKIKSLNAPKLQVLGMEAFLNCMNLDNVYLPELVEAMVRDTFTGCTALSKITFGKNARSLVNNMFDGTDGELKITILNPNTVVTTGTYIRSSNLDKVTVLVPAVIHTSYTKFSNVPVNNIKKFGSTSEIDGLTYYWDGITKPIFKDGILVNPNDCTAYIDYVEGTLPTNLTLPSTFTADVDVLDNDGNTTGKTVSVTYKVISVSAEAMKALSDVTSVTLPANMQYLTFTTADIAKSVTTLEIASTNGYFKTQNGVLYTKDGSTLLVYPRGRTAASFTVGSGVTEIAYRAFYGANIEEITISDSVTVRDQAFESATGINSIDLTSGKNVTFAGRDTFLGANTNLVINKNGATVNILTDYSIAEKLR